MRIVAAIPAAGLLAGAGVGLLLAESQHASTLLLIGRPAMASGLMLAIVGAVVAWRAQRPVLLAVGVAIGFFTGGVRLADDAWQRAWRPPLRAHFETLARTQRTEAEREGRRPPGDDEAFAVVEGVLRADASLTEAGASLSVDVEAIALGGPAFAPEALRRVSPELAGDGAASGGGQGSSEHTERTAGGIVVTVVGSLGSRLDEWRAGRRVRLPVALHRPARYLDPGVPDHERALARRGTTLVGTVKSGALVEVTARGSRFDEAMAAVRAFARIAIADAVGGWSQRSAAIVAAIVIGDRAGLDDRVQRALQDAGTYHVIAISGGNIAILAGLFVGAFRLAGWLGRSAMVSAIVVLVLYAQLVGGGASVDRATLMAAAYFGARVFDHRTPPLNALALVAAMLVAVDPLGVADPAFVLTFGATLAILIVVPASGARGEPVEPRALRSPFGRLRASAITQSFVAMFAASLAVEALLFPIGAMFFSRITFAGLALNFLAIPLMAVAQIAGMLVVPGAAVSRAAASAAGWVAHVGAAGLVASADLVRFAPLLAYRVAAPPWLAIGLYYAALAAWWVLRRRRSEVRGSAETTAARRIRLTAAACAAACGIWILVDPRTLAAARGDGRLHATFIDVGQGDSIFVVFPRGSTMLVDAGGLSMASAFDIGDRVVAPVIRAAGFRRLDELALTHGDPDHVGGAASIAAEFRPREVWEGIPVPRLEALATLRRDVEADGGRWRSLYSGARRLIDDVDVIVHHPLPADWERQKVRNDDSLVIELRWRDVSILLTGDIGRVPERAIAASITPAKIRVVKIPHHGSLTSSTPDFVHAIHPAIAIVSAGRSNHFGHPVPEVLDRYRSEGAEIFRTDRDGAIALDSDGTSISIRTFTGRAFSTP